MIIGVDIRSLANPVHGGIQEYTEQVLRHLIPLAKDHQIKLFFSSYRQTPPDFDWMHESNVKVCAFKIPNNLLFISQRIFGWPKIDKMVGGVDVWFSPHFLLAPLSPQVKRVSTFHDLSYLKFPEFFSLKQLLWHMQMQPKYQARLSDKIISVSHSTKSDLVEHYHIDPSNIEVIYSGTSLIKPEEGQIKAFKVQQKLQRYILSLGTLEPRKNTITIIKAFNLLKQQPGFEDLELVIAGARGWLFEPVMMEMSLSPFKQQIRYIDSVDSTDRELWYASASVLVYPSFFEGFGLPPLEAMRCGVPVITSANSSLPEVVGDAGLLIDPNSISELVRGLRVLFEDADLHRQLSSRSITQSYKFTWENTAHQTLALITRLGG